MSEGDRFCITKAFVLIDIGLGCEDLIPCRRDGVACISHGLGKCNRSSQLVFNEVCFQLVSGFTSAAGCDLLHFAHHAQDTAATCLTFRINIRHGLAWVCPYGDIIDGVDWKVPRHRSPSITKLRILRFLLVDFSKSF